MLKALDLERRREQETDTKIISRVEEIAKKRGVSMAIVSMAWVMKKGACPIVGLSSEERMDEAIAAIDFKLTDEEEKYLEEPYLPKRVVGNL
jgi:aryl-alcohol dehydrogenase-like predicted oxidoreductase